MTNEFDIKYQSETIFTVLHDGKEIAWCQWSPVYDLWRVLVLSDKRVHHLMNMMEIMNLCSDEIGC
jgi:hypothetical protein